MDHPATTADAPRDDTAEALDLSLNRDETIPARVFAAWFASLERERGGEPTDDPVRSL